MALVKCAECGKEISSNAVACPSCGNPMRQLKGNTTETQGTYCPRCKTHVTPVVTSVGGGSCSFGKRETWKCPNCFRVLHRSGCFVATITYGDENFVEVVVLRAFRDEILSQSRVGRATIWSYYNVAPFAAKCVEIVPFAKPICRVILDCIIIAIEKRTSLKRDSYRFTDRRGNFP